MVIAPPQLGQVVLGSFQLQRELGVGAFATAYLADQLGTDRRAVVKVPHPHLIAGKHGAEIRRRFEVEARAATRVVHPNLVTIYTVGQTPGGLPAIAMEFVEGEPLFSRLSRMAPLPLVQLAQLGEQLAQALLALHEVGIVHRDLSPSNVIVRDRTNGLFAKVLDFGVAKRLDAPTRTLGPMGTPGYLAPEQLQGQVSPRSDVYSLGAILWWALTGHERPDDYSDGSLLARIGSTVGPNPLSLNAAAPPALAAVVSRMLIPDHRLRPTVQEFLDQWRHALAEVSDHAQPPARAPATIPAAPDTVPTRTGPAPIAIVVDNPVLRSLVTGYVGTHGEVEVQICDLRQVMRANPGSHSVLVLDAALSEVDTREVVPLLAECHDDLAIIVIGSAAQAVTPWAAFGAHEFLALPEQLEQLRVTVTRALGRSTTIGTTSGSRLTASFVDHMRVTAPHELLTSLESFMGYMPQWIAELQIALELGDSARALSACEQLSSAASLLGIQNLVRLAQTAQAFITSGDSSSAAAFAASIEAEYHKVFVEVFHLMKELRQSEVTS